MLFHFISLQVYGSLAGIFIMSTKQLLSFSLCLLGSAVETIAVPGRPHFHPAHVPGNFRIEHVTITTHATVTTTLAYARGRGMGRGRGPKIHVRQDDTYAVLDPTTTTSGIEPSHVPVSEEEDVTKKIPKPFGTPPTQRIPPARDLPVEPPVIERSANEPEVHDKSKTSLPWTFHAPIDHHHGFSPRPHSHLPIEHHKLDKKSRLDQDDPRVKAKEVRAPVEDNKAPVGGNSHFSITQIRNPKYDAKKEWQRNGLQAMIRAYEKYHVSLSPAIKTAMKLNPTIHEAGLVKSTFFWAKGLPLNISWNSLTGKQDKTRRAS